MALDDQLAALAAGELDDDTARALRARAAADPALARRLARHEQLQHLLAAWEAPAMSADGARRLESRLDEALAALGDEPLAERRMSSTAATAAAATDETDATDERAGGGSGQAGVVDMARARRRREDAGSDDGGTSWTGWAGAAVAAVLAGIVGTGVVLGGLSSGDGIDMLAEDDSAEESTQDAPDVAQLESDDSGASDSMMTESADGAAADDADVRTEDSARLGPQRGDVDVAEGELLTLVDPATDTTAAAQESGSGDETAEDTSADEGGETAAEPAQQCVEEALRRDTSQADDREVWLLATGTYAGRDAAFVVVRTPQDSGPDRYEVLAYDPGDCSLLARDETSR